MHLRRGCPYPFADSDDALNMDCLEETWQSIDIQDDVFEKTVNELVPYMKYDVRLRVWNSGVVDYVESANAFITKPSGESVFLRRELDNLTLSNIS